MPVIGGAQPQVKYRDNSPAGYVARPRVVDVRDYGAKGDGVARSDATVTSGSATVTAPGASFTAADVGKLIAIYDNTNVTVTTIQAVVSATQITLASTYAHPDQTNRYFVYGTDNATPVNNALAALGTTAVDKSKTLYFPAGTYLDSGTHDLSLTNNITILGDSSKQWPRDGLTPAPLSDWRCVTPSTGSFINASGSVALSIIGMGIRAENAYAGTILDLSGHASRHTFNFTARHCTFGQTALSDPNGQSVDVRGVVLATFEHCLFWGMKYGVVTTNGTDTFSNVVNFRDCIWQNYTTNAVYLSGVCLPTQWLFDGCTIEESTTGATSAIVVAKGDAFTFNSSGFWDSAANSAGGVQQTGANTLHGWKFNGCYFEYSGSGFGVALKLVDGLSFTGCNHWAGGGTNSVFKTGMTATHFHYEGNSHQGVTDNSGITGGSLTT